MSAPVSREALYSEVWAEPMTTVASRYGVSSSFLARVCASLNVPRPARGYWAKLAVGKRVAQPALPRARPEDALEWTRGQPEPLHARRPLPVAPERRARRSRRSTAQPDTLHPLIAGAREHFVGVGTADSGHLRPTKRRLVDLYVSEATIDRAIAFASSLFWELDGRGYRVTLPRFDQRLSRPALDERKERVKQRDRYELRHGTWSPDRPTVVHVGSVAIGLGIFEQSERLDVQYVDGKIVPVAQLPQLKRRGGAPPTAFSFQKDLASGRLCLRAASPYWLAPWERYWEETEARSINTMIPDIVRGIEDAAVVVAALAKEGAAKAEADRMAWERQRAESQRLEAERARERQTQASREQLSEIIATWSVATAREDFFADLERRAAMLDTEAQSALRQRIHRARAMLGGPDILARFASWQDSD